MSRLKLVAHECKSPGCIDRWTWEHECSCGAVHIYGKRPERCFTCGQPIEGHDDGGSAT